MKYIIIIFAAMLFAGNAKAQTYDTIPPYQKDSTLPKFLLLNEDSTWFNTAQLPKKTPVVIIFFNPDCSHCQHEAEELVKEIDKIKNIFFLWTTYAPTFEEIKQFADQYGLSKYKNMHFYKDPNYTIPSFYRLEMTPFMAGYDKKGMLIKTWTAGAKPDDLKEALLK
ncbi:MAG: redoxin domain-containing protein [Arachidicoccus sp.]|nr:redoxin domain-containing protein [Arachidicoccus sp.]